MTAGFKMCTRFAPCIHRCQSFGFKVSYQDRESLTDDLPCLDSCRCPLCSNRYLTGDLGKRLGIRKAGRVGQARQRQEALTSQMLHARVRHTRVVVEFQTLQRKHLLFGRASECSCNDCWCLQTTGREEGIEGDASVVGTVELVSGDSGRSNRSAGITAQRVKRSHFLTASLSASTDPPARILQALSPSPHPSSARLSMRTTAPALVFPPLPNRRK